MTIDERLKARAMRLEGRCAFTRISKRGRRTERRAAMRARGIREEKTGCAADIKDAIRRLANIAKTRSKELES